MLTTILAGIGNMFVTVMILGALRVPTLRELKTRLRGLTDTAGPHRVHCGNTDDDTKASNKTKIWFFGPIMKRITFPLLLVSVSLPLWTPTRTAKRLS